MSNCQIRFNYCEKDVIIKCERNELIKDIINRFGIKLGLSVDEFYYLYGVNKINLELTLRQINDKDKEILVLVFPKDNIENENTLEKSNIIRSTQNHYFETQTKKNSEDNNEIVLKIKIEKGDLNNTIYFLDNTKGYYLENDKVVKHNHDGLTEINEKNTLVIIDEEAITFKKYFIPTKIGTYSIRFIFKIKLSSCAYMFCQCKNIVDIDFSKFNSENVADMQRMFYGCSSLQSLNIASLKTENVTNMSGMFNGCFLLKSLNLSSFNTQNVINMMTMFCGCSSLTTINLSSFNTQSVNNMMQMFNGCSSLKKLNLSSFNTQNVTDMMAMFNLCSSLTKINLLSFNTQNVNNMIAMFYKCSSLTSIDLSSFNTKNVTKMQGIFDDCTSLTMINLSSFNVDKADIRWMFKLCINLPSCGSCDKKIVDEFNNSKKI